jgi:SAM-dependent methyltransferase
MDGASHSLYPFLLPLLLAHVSGYAISWRWWRGGRLVPVLVVSAIAGFATGFSSNLRTSYLPVWIALFAITLLAAAAAWSGSRSAKIWRAAAGCVVFGVSFWAYQYWFIDRHLPRKFHYNASYHTVAHPLVLSLANPPSDLSRREGIEWSDGAGERIAQRIDPRATYLGNTYDRILFQYYRDLWRKHPGEMAGIYLRKFSATGVSIIDAMRGYSTVSGRLMRWLLTPLAVLRSGILLILCCLAVAGGAFIVSRRRGGAMPILIALLCASAVLLLMESAIIHPNFAPQYHGYLMMFFPMMTLFGIQGVVQILLGPALGTASHPARKTAQYFDAISDDFEARMNPFDLRSRMDWFDRGFDRFAPGRLVLDVGSGLGHFADLARARGAIVVPVDLAPRLVSRLKTRYSAAVCASATSLPFLEGTFDAVISSECIEHTPDPPLAVAEMLRVLKRGGHLYVTTPNLVWRWSVWLAERLGVRQFEGIENWLSRAAVRRTLADNGAIIEVSEGLHILPFQLRPLWPVIGWMNARGQWANAVMINQCWIARK